MGLRSSPARHVAVVPPVAALRRPRNRLKRCAYAALLVLFALLVLLEQANDWRLAPAAAAETPGDSPFSPSGELTPFLLQSRLLDNTEIARLGIPDSGIDHDSLTAWPQRSAVDAPAIEQPSTGPSTGTPVVGTSDISQIPEQVFVPEVDTRLDRFPKRVSQWHTSVAQHWPRDQVVVALCVIQGESGGETDAHNTAPTEADGGSVGLFQIALDNVSGKYRISGLEDEPIRNKAEALALLLDPQENVRFAAAMWRAEGWLPAWEAQRKYCDLKA